MKIGNEFRAAHDIHAGFDVAAADENEIDPRQRFRAAAQSRRRAASFGQATSPAPAAAISAHNAVPNDSSSPLAAPI